MTACLLECSEVHYHLLSPLRECVVIACFYICQHIIIFLKKCMEFLKIPNMEERENGGLSFISYGHICLFLSVLKYVSERIKLHNVTFESDLRKGQKSSSRNSR